MKCIIISFSSIASTVSRSRSESGFIFDADSTLHSTLLPKILSKTGSGLDLGSNTDSQIVVLQRLCQHLVAMLGVHLFTAKFRKLILESAGEPTWN